MRMAAMSCPSCQVRVEGNFSETLFDRLGPQDQKFLEEYLLAGFSIKTLEENSSMGYAAIRSRLDHLIASYQSLVEMEAHKKVILERLRSGEISVTEAKGLLEKLAGE